MLSCWPAAGFSRSPRGGGCAARSSGGTGGDGGDPIADLVGYRQHAVLLSRAELLQLIEGMRAAILPVLSNEASPDRARYLLSPILFPVGEQSHSLAGERQNDVPQREGETDVNH